MRTTEKAPLYALFDILGNGQAGTEKGHGPRALADVFRQPQPCLEEATMSFRRLLKLLQPQEIRFQEHGSGKPTRQFLQDGALAGSAGPADEQKGQTQECVRMAALSASRHGRPGIPNEIGLVAVLGFSSNTCRPGNGFVSTIEATMGADVYHISLATPHSDQAGNLAVLSTGILRGSIQVASSWLA